ncbi:MAG: hypothetical protein JSS02_05365 [Planctomycetes bacterium]|nr:hypothetical protein [Planctomycetota bacterium]
MRVWVSWFGVCWLGVWGTGALVQAADVDFSKATVVVRAGERPAAELAAERVLIEEVARKTGLTWQVTTDWPAQAEAIIALSVNSTPPAWKDRIPASALGSPTLKHAEGFAVRVQDRTAAQSATVYVTGSDPRGLLFGVGKLLRSAAWGRGRWSLPAGLAVDLSPRVPLRGHQLGYRARANSWDAWTVAQFDQYIRELVIFGANAIENIPFEDSDPSPVMKVPRSEMNLALSQVCARYDVEYWLWIPVEFRLPDAEKERAALRRQEEFYRTCPRIDAVFVPGGDPGDNPARTLLPHVRQMAELLRKYHPRAKLWVSLQKFSPSDLDDFYRYVSDEQPAWLGGVVMGPSSPPLEPTRARLPKNYPIRWYPDITHTIRSQYEVPWFDPALGMTLGREPCNPRPVDYTAIYREGAPFTNGFLTYSDGIHDDFNKDLWSLLGWEPERSPREFARDYARYFFGPEANEAGADAIFALETNWRGSLADNSSVDGTLLTWQKLDQQLPAKTRDWRFDLHLHRAYYDAYTRHRLLYETDLEEQALRVLSRAQGKEIPAALKQARTILARASTEPIRRDWYEKLDQLAEALFQSVGYQTRLERYFASGSERGAVMDFLDYPLNNRWWLEEEFDRVEKLADPAEQVSRVAQIVHWQHPQAGDFYDNLGNVAQSPRIGKLLYMADAMRLEDDLPAPTQRWVGDRRRPLRLAWHTYLNRPPKMTYAGLDPRGRYVVRLFAQRTSPLLIDGQPVKPSRLGETYDQVQEQEFEVPAAALADGRLELTWDRLDETALNWRNRHYVCEVWVLKQK